jgi:hypothetical protein
MWEYVGYMDVDKESKLYSRTYRMRVPGGYNC